MLPPVIARFKADYPNVRLLLHQASPKEIADVLLEDKTDIGIATDAPGRSSGHLRRSPIILGNTWSSFRKDCTRAAQGTDARRHFRVPDRDVIDEGLTGRGTCRSRLRSSGPHARSRHDSARCRRHQGYVDFGWVSASSRRWAFDPARDTGSYQLKTKKLFEPRRRVLPFAAPVSPVLCLSLRRTVFAVVERSNSPQSRLRK